MDARDLVAWNIRRIRVVRGISSETLAARADVDRSYLSRLERRVANPSIDVLERIARVLGVEMSELFAVPEPNEKRPVPLSGGRRRTVAPRTRSS
jgi:transcriptional regulator with XRE-family HTH domain